MQGSEVYVMGLDAIVLNVTDVTNSFSFNDSKDSTISFFDRFEFLHLLKNIFYLARPYILCLQVHI